MAKGANILIIEDDRDLVSSMRVIFESADYNVRAAYNGKDGYDQIQKKKPDLIILDVMMATDTEGFDLAFKLRNQAEYRNIPIIMVTGFTQRMAELGPEKFQHILGEDWPVTKIFEKPIDPDELMAAVEIALKEQRKG
ncbi:MAG TPA: response regulator [Syntrophobacteria bacterium]|jgi:DNA-binding response OmpR family regulator|nr:response regulator [Syntrophobacteria bacterium]